MNSETKKDTYYGFSVWSTDYDGFIVYPKIFKAKKHCLKRAYKEYKDRWNELVEEGYIESGVDANGNGILSEKEFFESIENEPIVIQCENFHDEFTFFETEVN